ncbi:MULTISPECIES: S41 family peptidase [unclassified Sphingomonas]|uniref:S41 family peptidase n=1 Tax=unclassified Sphingomonas TaxID=196159 RepID=UPI0006FD9D3C|nr:MULTISPECIES: S41 family peptidase [unclassified Sphingomonas]KQX19070.1 peptidase S41 [Sphingomonas sp. Root1294]KQY65271.1 peptidase S41 [Sphingomonas sp. Root50]KRB95434.1 peptidase S41 [Sphingomonas sp. Root720]
MRRPLQSALLVCLIAMAGAGAVAREDRLNERVFDRAWELAGDRYWDRSLGGNDWGAIRDRFYPQAVAARDEKQLYAVVNRMLDQLDDSHVYATSPSQIAWSKEPPEERDMPPARRLVRLDGGLLLLSFNQFDPGDDRWIRQAIEETPGLRGVILDLRGNGGGRDDVLDKVAGIFTPERRVLIRLTGKRSIEEKTRGSGDRAYLGPLAVVVGPDTASAAEILAFFLDENGRAFSVGQRSAGAVTGGVDHDLPGGGRITIAEYDIRTANGVRLEGNGFTPRYRVPTATEPNDLALAKAVALLKGEPR